MKRRQVHRVLWISDVQRRKELAGFLERLTRMKKACFWNGEDQKKRCLVGETPEGVYFVPDARSTPREEIYTWVKV